MINNNYIKSQKYYLDLNTIPKFLLEEKNYFVMSLYNIFYVIYVEFEI